MDVKWNECLPGQGKRDKIVERWSPPPPGIFKFNIDEVAREKPGPTGIGGVLHDEEGLLFFWNMDEEGLFRY